MISEAGTMPNATNLKDEIDKKLAQADGILSVTRCARDFLDRESPICDALWAASELIEDSKRAVQELYEQAQEADSIGQVLDD
jgi:hypothetical protein